MKKILFTVMIMLLAAVLPVWAGEPTEYEIPSIGTEISGFVVTDIYRYETYATDIVELTHEKTGAVLYWLANDNIDRSYMMSFRTPVNDNTGMAHVFEHATLGGSTKYPGANTFFEMTSKTSNTFLNAMTGQYYTMYPMASTSEEQLLMFVDYYMNGLTDPLALTNPYALMREAYRYELDDPEGEISLQGVVYSEMLGALSQARWASINFNRMLWPNSYVTTVSGGDPVYIPDLTVEALSEFHETYYHPSNSTMYLTGDLYLPRFLELLDSEFLSKYDQREIVIEDVNYTPLESGSYEQVFEFAAEEGASTDRAAILYYGMPFEISDYVDMELLDYFCYYMNDESSPFQRKLTEEMPEVSASVSTSWDPEGKTALVFAAQSINESEKDQFKAICDETLAQVLEEGVSEEVLNAILISRQFSDLLSMDSSQLYLNLSQLMTIYWTIFGERDSWKLSAEFDNHLTEYVTAENVNAAARKYFSGLDTFVTAVTVPVPGLKEQNDAALKASLAEMKASMTPEEVNALVEQTQAFQAFVEESNAITMPEELNALSVENLPEEMSYQAASLTNIGGIRVITSEVDTPLIHVSFGVDASVIPYEDLFDFIEFASLIGTLGTDQYTREELPSKMDTVSYGMSVLSTSVSDNYETGELDFYGLTSWYALSETLEDSFALVEDILLHTDFSDYDYIRSDAAQTLAIYSMYLDQMGLTLAADIAAAPFSPSSKLDAYLDGAAYLSYLEKIANMSDEEMDVLVEKFEGFRKLILNRNGAYLTVMGSGENIIRATALGYNFLSSFSGEEPEHYDYGTEIADIPLHSAVVTGGSIVYNLMMTDIEAAGYDKADGGLRVVAKLIDDKLLYPELRVKNSAYGGYSLIYSSRLFGYYSYRDPKVAETYEVYAAAGDFLRNLEISETELAGYINSVHGDLTAPLGPISAAQIGINDAVDGCSTYDRTMKMIREIKAFTPADIANYADLADTLIAEGTRVTAGSRSMIEADADLFDYINYDMINAADGDGTDADELIEELMSMSDEEFEAMMEEMSDEEIEALITNVAISLMSSGMEEEEMWETIMDLFGDYIEE